jgi:5'-nucleotidase/UDP-sugar diphosphatase
MKARRRFWFVIGLLVSLLGLFTGCAPTITLSGAAKSTTESAPALTDEHVVTLTLLHMNDVYEITPVAGGTQGGLARVATVRKELLTKNRNTFTILAGDLFNPSAMGTAQVGGEPLNGRHIVDVMNVVGLDYATFGNHEFDLSRKQFLKRLSESKATWFSSNTFDARRQPFPNVPAHVVFTVSNHTKHTARVGMFGLTTTSNQPDYVRYADPLEKAREQVAALRGQVDILIAVTHLSTDEDMRLVEASPEIDLVIGGHEHENIQQWRGPNLTPIVKADANARTVYVHDFMFNTATRTLEMVSRLRKITSDIPEDPAVAARVKGWVEQAFAGFRAQGFEPERVVATVPEPLDGTEASVRHRATCLTELIGQGMLHSVPNAEWAVYNAGSIRIDDVLLSGNITEYDIIRTLPFGGTVLAVDMKGALLQRVLAQGMTNRGTGGFLQTFNPSNQPIQPDRTYLVAINDFLLTGRERDLPYLTRDNPDLRVRSEGAPYVDIRQALIAELRRQYPVQAMRRPTPSGSRGAATPDGQALLPTLPQHETAPPDRCLSKVWPDVRMCRSLLIPGFHPLLQPCEMLLVRHRL